MILAGAPARCCVRCVAPCLFALYVLTIDCSHLTFD